MFGIEYNNTIQPRNIPRLQNQKQKKKYIERLLLNVRVLIKKFINTTHCFRYNLIVSQQLTVFRRQVKKRIQRRTYNIIDDTKKYVNI